MASLEESIKRYIDRRIEDLRSEVDDLTALGALMSTNDDPDTDAEGNELGGVQTGQVGLSDYDADDAVALFQQCGISARPPSGSRGIVLRMGDQRVGFLFGPEARPHSLEPGETIVYSTAGGSTVKLDQDGNITTTAGGETGASVRVAADGSFSVTNASGQTINLGGDAAQLSVAIAEQIEARLEALGVALAAFVPAPGDGGKALAGLFVAWLEAIAEIPIASETTKTAP